jgi:hypothetical protein
MPRIRVCLALLAQPFRPSATIRDVYFHPHHLQPGHAVAARRQRQAVERDSSSSRPTRTAPAGPAILMWNGTTKTIAEGNTFIDCRREIAFGLIESTVCR